MMVTLCCSLRPAGRPCRHLCSYHAHQYAWIVQLACPSGSYDELEATDGVSEDAPLPLVAEAVDVRGEPDSSPSALMIDDPLAAC